MKIQQTIIFRLIVNSSLFYLIVWLYDPAFINSLPTLWDKLLAFAFIGIIFSALNAVVKPIIMLLTLPAMLLSVGLFTIIINGLIVYITTVFTPTLSLGFGQAIIAGLIMSLANYLITSLFLEER